MFLDTLAARTPNKPAFIMAGSRDSVTYHEFNTRTIQGANLLRASGLTQGNRVVIYMENRIAFLESAWACIRAGLYFVPAGRHLREPELHYILEDSGAKMLITSTTCLKSLHVGDLPANIERIFVVGEHAPADGQYSWESEIRAQPVEASEGSVFGAPMFYSSGTTGRPKGVYIPLSSSQSEFWKSPPPPEELWAAETGIIYDDQTRSLITGPLFHVSPYSFACTSMIYGGTAVIMEKFDPEWTLQLIEEFRISHAYMVPTMFIKLLLLDTATRARYNISTLRHLEHGSGPCPVRVKEQIIEWFGPIVFEIYGASEPAGATFITSKDWLTHKGSVGRANGAVHILDDRHGELPSNQVGEVFFSGAGEFEYLNAPDKKRKRSTNEGWFSYGDLGYIDGEGYLFLVDRKDNMIIVGGQKVYPLEVENLLTAHPSVADVAVVGIPDPVYGQEVRAFVQLRDPTLSTQSTAKQLQAYCHSNIAFYKCPKSIEFVDSLPRSEHGKLLKRYLAS